MEHRRRGGGGGGGGKDSFSYSNLFNLESLMNYKVPQPDDEFDYYGNSSQDESRGSQGAVMANYGNGGMSDREMSLAKRKRRSNNSDGEEEDGFYGTRITEDRYRSMLGEHIQKYKRRIKDSSSSPVPVPPRTAIPLPKSGLASLRTRKLGNDQRGGLYDLEATSDWPNDSTILKRGDNHEPDVSLKTYYEPALLDIGEGPPYIIPPPYNKLAPSLNLPSFSDLRVEEFYLKGTLDLGSLATLIASDKRLGPRSRAGMGETWPQYESLQAKLKALTASNSGQNFSLKISDAALKSSIPEGAAGNIQRYILSEGGALQVYYVKVLEKGDTYEIIERSLPKKPKVKKDPSVIEREEMEKISKVWVNIVRRDIPKYQKVFTNFHRKQLIDAKRFSESCQREVKVKVSRSLKMMRGAGIRTRKLARDMLLFWKRVDKEMADLRKKQEREAAEARKRELELREARRQEQRLNFLIQQTEIYSHFMQNSSYMQPSDVLSAGEEKQDGQGMLLSTSEPGPGGEEDLEEAELRKKALNAARDAVLRQKKLTSDFDAKYSKLRQGVDTEDPLADSKVGVSSDMDLQTPSTMPITSTVKTPRMFRGSLKEYQLKGLQWLVNCYEKGLNGILADEMGLGKTIQAMAFLAHLAEEKDTWGPFLVVAPASVLNNWADEISRFCPDLKTLPYWGGLQERVVLRKKINARTPGFHILITSYQLLVSDEKYLKRVKWNFIILDEAQAIKSSASIRWNTLKKFECRNRLLLTGTPIQNNMAELWALLHFIMPELFNDHEQFDEWFSKGIENHAERGGTLNEHQLNRLHAILKPFMLRRVKKDVVSELTRKTEVMVHCRLSSRQQAFYQAIKNKISLAELFDGNRGHLNEKKIMNLMNIVIQLRKVCNHPELFERNVGSTYLYFAEQHNSLLPHGFGELEDIYYSGNQNPILYQIPKLILNETLRSSEACSSAVGLGIGREWIHKHFNICSSGNIYRSVFAQQITSRGLYVKSGAFGFTHLMDLSPAEVAFLATGSFMERLLFSMLYQERPFLDGILDFLMEEVDNDSHCNHLERGTLRAVTRMLLMPSRSEKLLLREYAAGPVDAPYEALVVSHQDRLRSNTKLLHSTYTFIPKARAPPICAHCSDRNFSYKMIEELHQPWIKRLLVGFARTSEFNGPRKPPRLHPLIEEIDSGLPVLEPALQLTYRIFGSCPPMQSFDSSKLLTDSGKLQTLDILLKRLRAENHRVLLFAQMTKMLNILEDYMNYKKYKYLRLDGSSSILERREMVRDFQHRNDIFVFLLSTRAGGLGINLTAADTVIFYESDWNPTLDLQAMDRAHRLGQTKDVTVYRLICKDTVEEKILLRASQKNTVQQLVMTGGRVQFGDLMAPDDVVSLVLDDPELQQKFREISLLAKERQKRHPTKAIKIDAEGDATLADWTEEGNDPDAEKANSNNKKRKGASDQKAPARSRNSQKKNSSIDYDYELDEPFSSAGLQSERPRRPKRPKKSVNENLEPAFTAAPMVESSQTEYPPLNGLGSTPSNA